MLRKRAFILTNEFNLLCSLRKIFFYKISMKVVKVDDPNVVQIACDVLESGGVVMHPTETCYGLAVDISYKEAVEKLYDIKGREENKPVSILVSKRAMALEYGEFSDKALELAIEHWPGPLSIVVPRKRILPDYFNPGEDFVSIRHSSSDLCTDIVHQFRKPITTTSANVSGKDPLYKPDVSDFDGKIDLLIDGGELREIHPTTVVKVVDDEIEVIRQGEITV